MRYLVMEPDGGMQLPLAPKGEDADVVISSDLSRFYEVDYDMRSELISEQLKKLIELYMPRFNFRPVVYIDQPKEEQLVFWRFRPAVYEADYKVTFRNDGIVSGITLPNNNTPVIFTVRSPKGVRSILVRLAVAESVLRRGIFGVKFTKVTED